MSLTASARSRSVAPLDLRTAQPLSAMAMTPSPQLGPLSSVQATGVNAFPASPVRKARPKSASVRRSKSSAGLRWTPQRSSRRAKRKQTGFLRARSGNNLHETAKQRALDIATAQSVSGANNVFLAMDTSEAARREWAQAAALSARSGRSQRSSGGGMMSSRKQQAFAAAQQAAIRAAHDPAKVQQHMAALQRERGIAEPQRRTLQSTVSGMVKRPPTATRVRPQSAASSRSRRPPTPSPAAAVHAPAAVAAQQASARSARVRPQSAASSRSRAPHPIVAGPAAAQGSARVRPQSAHPGTGRAPLHPAASAADAPRATYVPAAQSSRRRASLGKSRSQSQLTRKAQEKAAMILLRSMSQERFSRSVSYPRDSSRIGTKFAAGAGAAAVRAAKEAGADEQGGEEAAVPEASPLQAGAGPETDELSDREALESADGEGEEEAAGFGAGDILDYRSLKPNITMRKDSSGQVWPVNAKFTATSVSNADYPAHPLQHIPPPREPPSQWNPTLGKACYDTESRVAFVKWDMPAPPTRPPVKVPKSLAFTHKTEAQMTLLPPPADFERARPMHRRHVIPRKQFVGESMSHTAYSWNRKAAAEAKPKAAALQKAHDWMPQQPMDYKTVYAVSNEELEKVQKRDGVVLSPSKVQLTSWSPWAQQPENRSFVTESAAANTILDRSLKATLRLQV